MMELLLCSNIPSEPIITEFEVVTMPDGPVPAGRRYSFSATVAGDDIYIFGGHITSNMGDFWRWDTINNTFTSLTSPLSARHGTGMCYHPALDRIYFFGGNTGTITRDFVYYDLTAQTTVTVTGDTGRPTARHHTRLVHCPINGKLYSVGSNSSPDFYEYDPATNAWTTLAVCPVAMGMYEGIVAIGSSLYCTLGTSLYIYDINTNVWSSPINLTVAGRLGLKGKQFLYSCRSDKVSVFNVFANVERSVITQPFNQDRPELVVTNSGVFILWGANNPNIYSGK